jgi:hypothetical protein
VWVARALFLLAGALGARSNSPSGVAPPERGRVLTSDAPRVVTAVCETTPCSDVCNAGYTLGSDGSCIANPTVTAGNGFVDNGDGTVTDLGSGLLWLKEANCAGTI